MPVVQSVFNDDFAVGYPGMVANGEISNRISRSAEEEIPFGRAVFRGANDHGCSLTVANALLGIALADKGIPMMTPGQTVDAYPQYSNVGIMERGVIWVTNGAGALTEGDDIAVLNADGTFVVAGTAASTALTGWVADMDAAAGEMVRITNNRA